MTIHVIGGGLAGSEAAYQLARKGHDVKLYEMRPGRQTRAHQTDKLGELVCSNSLRSSDVNHAAGLLKEELRRAGSLIMEAADACRLPAGGALAVDREGFSAYITKKVEEEGKISLERCHVEALPPLEAGDYLIIASGPLTEGPLAESIQDLSGRDYFHFYDAAAPVVTAESIDMSVAWWASRYDKGEADYINCPLDEDQYQALVRFLQTAPTHKPTIEGEEVYFEGCMPVEEMARRGEKTLSFGPLKPVGLINPHTEKSCHAVVQLRIDNHEKTLFNLVGFQTSLTFAAQKEMLTLIPGLEKADIVRYGVMHQNSYINSPYLLGTDGRLLKKDQIYFAGQITGVEGYIESTASGLIAALSIQARSQGQAPLNFPTTTAMGSLMNYITTKQDRPFQPMNINWGLIPKPEKKIRKKKERNAWLSARALADLEVFLGLKDQRS